MLGGEEPLTGPGGNDCVTLRNRDLLCVGSRAVSSALSQGHPERRGSRVGRKMQLVEAERPPLESDPCVTLNKSLGLSVPQYSPLENGND